MSTSGSNVRVSTYTGFQMTERALRMAGVKSAQFTDEMVAIAFDVVNVMLLDFLNLGMQLWGRDRVILPVYLNKAEVPLPLGSSVVFDCTQRTLMRPEPLLMNSFPDGDARLAFDGDLATACMQSAPGGVIEAIYASPVQITTVGLNALGPGPWAYMVEYDLLGDGNWQAIDAVSTEFAADRQWQWNDIDGAPSAIGWRIRNVGESALFVYELYFGNTPNEIPMGPWNVDDYDANPVKLSPGQPLIYFQDRRLDIPTLIVWPVPDQTSIFMQLVARRRRYLNALTDMQQSFDLSPRWYEFATTSLARRLCKELPEADMSRFQMLQAEELSSLLLAQGEERDPAPERYNPGLEVYNF